MKNALDIIENIDSEIINEADTYKREKKKNIRLRYGVIAACLCIAAAGIFGAKMLFGKSNISAESPASETAVSDKGVYIPAVRLPDNASDAQADMICFVVYGGGIYTQSESYYGTDAVKTDALVGNYLGYATGKIDERSKQEEYEKEFASSVEGKVYDVIGYDKDFRICIRNEFEDENGEKQLWIQFLDRLNGITLTTGADLFEARLHLRERTEKIQRQSHSDWDNGRENIQNAEIDSALWEKFLAEVDAGSFVYTWNPENSDSTVYDTQNQAHIILTMKDGTAVRLRLIEGGYVGYDALGWYFVKIPGEIFDSVFSACVKK